VFLARRSRSRDPGLESAREVSMSSESNGRESESQAPCPPAVPSTRSTRGSSAWGATRDALAAAHNLDALLRGASVLYRTILDLLPELRTSAGVLRGAFEGARTAAATAGEALHEVGAYGVDRVNELERLLDATATGDEERAVLADRARGLADELEASADLLALLERAAAPVPTDVDAALVVRETVRLSGSGRGRELVVRFDEASAAGPLYADPYVIGPVLAMLVACLDAAGVRNVVVRARSTDAEVIFTVEAAAEKDAPLPTLAMRVPAAVPPTGSAARQVAEQIGATLRLGVRSSSLHLPRSPG
jgi:hypothetical protein